MNDTKHTPTPVGVEQIREWLVNGGHVRGLAASERAAHIVECVNAHDELVTALELIAARGGLTGQIAEDALAALAKVNGSTVTA